MDATEQEASTAIARLMPMIDAANNSNQAGENAVVAVVRAYDAYRELATTLRAFIRVPTYACDCEEGLTARCVGCNAKEDIFPRKITHFPDCIFITGHDLLLRLDELPKESKP